MKRPEGFDPKGPDAEQSGKRKRGAEKSSPASPTPARVRATPPTAPATPPSGAARPTPGTRPAPGASPSPTTRPTANAGPASPPTPPARPATGGPRRPTMPGGAATAPAEAPSTRDRKDTGHGRALPSKPAKEPKPEKRPRKVAAATTERQARRELARAARARRRFERGEVKRFTRRSRSRRRVWISLSAIAAVLVGVLAVAIYSPLLALRTVSVDGTARVDAAAVQKAVESQSGTPLALIDYDTITSQLAKFPLIRSYVTELVPPDTLMIHIVERAPVAAVVNGATFDLLDPAGIVVQSSPTRPEGVPIISIGDQDAKSAAFASVVEVLLALPPEVLAQVDTISATTKDNVTFALRGVGQTVVWGSSENSAYKAKVLAAMVAHEDPAARVEYDVSAPGSVVVTPK